MKRLTGIFLMLCALVLAGCNKDNYEAPKSCLTGRVVYEDEAVGLRQTGTGQDYNVLELYQPGFEGTGNIPVYVDQEGNFTVLVYDGTYRLVAKKGYGPWPDTGTELNFDVHGDMQIDFPVTPYYVVRNANFAVDGGQLEVTFDVVRGAFSLIEGDPAKLIESISLYLGKTRFVDDVTFCQKIDAEGLSVGTHTINVNLESSDLKKYDMLYVRIGVGTKGITQKDYTPGSERVK